MLSIFDRSPKLCDKISRRTILRAGGLAALGLSPLSHWKLKAATGNASEKKAKRCIVLFLMGGPPQHSTWDPKPNAPAEVRGEFGTIATSVPGIHIGELMPRTAGMIDKVAILRAMVTGDNAHSSSGYYMLTGVPHAPKNRENANPGAPNNWPTLGSVVQHLAQGPQLLPPAIRLPHHIYNTDGSVWPGQDSGWLGHTANPWLFNCEPASSDFQVDQFQLYADVTLNRLSKRRSLLNQFEARFRQIDHGRMADAYSSEQQQAFNILNSPQARSACDLGLESDKVRDRYGRGQFGQSVLLARRLVQAGVQFVHVNWFRGTEEPADAPCWDSHARESKRLKTVLAPPFDQAFTALISDLEQLGMLDETLIVCMAEFGRSPKLNAQGGRGHWGHVFSVALAGGGIRGGQVHGSSDALGAYPEEGIVRPEDLTATIFDRLGYQPETSIRNPLDRPLPISRGEIIREIV